MTSALETNMPKETLEKIPTSALFGFLQERGWTDEGRWGESDVRVFTKFANGLVWEALAPHSGAFGDSSKNMAATMNAVAAAEGLSKRDVFEKMRLLQKGGERR